MCSRPSGGHDDSDTTTALHLLEVPSSIREFLIERIFMMKDTQLEFYSNVITRNEPETPSFRLLVYTMS